MVCQQVAIGAKAKVKANDGSIITSPWVAECRPSKLPTYNSGAFKLCQSNKLQKSQASSLLNGTGSFKLCQNNKPHKSQASSLLNGNGTLKLCQSNKLDKSQASSLSNGNGKPTAGPWHHLKCDQPTIHNGLVLHHKTSPPPSKLQTSQNCKIKIGLATHLQLAWFQWLPITPLNFWIDTLHSHSQHVLLTTNHLSTHPLFQFHPLYCSIPPMFQATPPATSPN